jgi:5-(hydroxymethyl)furfural/furfural oxidase
VAFDMLSDKRDLARLAAAMRYAYETTRQPEIQVVTNGWFLGRNDDAVRAIGRPTRANRIKTGPVARLLDGGPLPQGILMPSLLGSERRMQEVFADERRCAAG